MTPFLHHPRTAGEARNRRWLDRSASFVWKQFADGVGLRVFMIAPAGHRPESKAPAVMFFHGGMWMLDYVSEFSSWALHLASRGIVCFLPEYRTHARFDVKADEIVQDGLDAWVWLHRNAEALGVDPDCITVAGSDAGGLMALHTAMQPAKRRSWWKFFEKPVLPLMPAAVAIFRGVVDTEAREARQLNAKGLSGKSAVSLNPCDLFRPHLPPLFCAHGFEDPLLDCGMREWFCDVWQKLGNKAEFVICPGVDHTLTNFEVNPTAFEKMLLAWETFMVEQQLWPASAAEPTALME
ncbi:MAG TPA: alpha/beta hydrolase [Candidatus Akkermansia intestinigallinarum]|uniref:Alpha/beta hydrolase n=1 Tax=Candidatus Akkermansia intestinigallinarum TaxID=2838431 RepID=A0A9D2AHU8_9BACT|nr:alpha/beta hydrolase [Candidatus Akkermansia intestinigallinarum]